MAIANLVLRFGLELGGVGALVYAGLRVPAAGPLRWVAAAGLSAALVTVWALVVAPNADNGISQPHKDLIGSALLVVAAAALGVAGQPQLAVGFALLVVANLVLLVVFGQEARDALTGAAR